MRFPAALLNAIRPRVLAVADRRPPDFVIGEANDPYLLRWWLIPRNRWFNVYLHHFLRSDDDRALHDHPWSNASILLEGEYLEHVEGQDRPLLRQSGCCYVRRAVAAHRVQLIDGLPVWTLFITGPKIRDWGFLCPQGWRRWQDFVAPETGAGTGQSITGIGCGEQPL